MLGVMETQKMTLIEFMELCETIELRDDNGKPFWGSTEQTWQNGKFEIWRYGGTRKPKGTVANCGGE